MKKLIIILSVLLVIAAAFAFTSRGFKTGISGTIDPVNGAQKVWAISGTDSTSVVPISGKFFLEVKAGNWKVVVEGTSPYKNAVVENILVQENQTTDAGVIKLPQ